MPVLRGGQLDLSAKTFYMVLSAPPGAGKTALALSAPGPLLLTDFDDGAERVNARFLTGVDVFKPTGYKEFVEFVDTPDFQRYRTVVIDTGGSLVTALQEWAITEKKQGKRGGGLSQQGFGVVKVEFWRLVSSLRTTHKKNIIFIFHAVEEKKDDVTQFRILCEGAAKNLVYTPADFAGMIVWNDGKAKLSFAPNPTFFTKKCYGIQPEYDIPDLTVPGTKNDLLSRIFAEARANIAAEAAAVAAENEKYNAAMVTGRRIIAAVSDPETAKQATDSIRDMAHALTSKQELRSALLRRLKEVGVMWNETAQKFVRTQESADAEKPAADTPTEPPPSPPDAAPVQDSPPADVDAGGSADSPPAEAV